MAVHLEGLDQAQKFLTRAAPERQEDKIEIVYRQLARLSPKSHVFDISHVPARS